MSSIPQGRGLRPAQVAQKMGIGLSTVWSKAKNEAGFPKYFKIGPRTTLFFEDEIDAYMTRRAAESRAA